MSAAEGFPGTNASELADGLLQQLGRYQVVQKLGQGGMGVVYLAHDGKLDRRVAIKVLPSESVNDPDALARFQREARALAKLSHPGIVQAYDTDQASGRHFLVMEYVEGTNLASLLREKVSLPPTVAADYVHQAALALQHAHDKGLVHRDLKPSNLLLTHERQVKILDLGLARFLQDKIADPSRTREGMGMGTPDYAAPEQFQDARAVDGRADIYALGCTLYHLMTGHVPFPGSSLSEKYAAHAHKEPAPVEERCPEVPGGLALVLRRMMAKQPADRFQTAREVAEALAPYVAGSSAAFKHFQSTSSWQGSQLTVTTLKTRGRGRRLAIVGLLAAAALVLMSIIWLQSFHRAKLTEQADLVVKPADLNGGGDNAAAETQQAAAEPNVLTISQDAKGGGDFRTIGAALDKAEPGMTVRVLDDATYSEAVLINRAAQHRGLVLEAPRHATLRAGAAQTTALHVSGVAGVSVRGFRLRAEAEKVTLVRLQGHSPGFLLEHVELEAGQARDYDGVLITNLKLADEDAPAVVRGCVLRRGKIGIGVIGAPATSRRIVIRQNTVADFSQGIFLSGSLQQLQIVGNRIYGFSVSGIQPQQLAMETEGLLIANNTLFDGSNAFRLWDNAVKGKNIQVCNNLVLGRPNEADMVFTDSGGDAFNPRGPGDGKLLRDAWQLHHNWRELKPDKSWDKGWIPLGKDDITAESIPVLSRQRDDTNFLRPAADSPLATAGAGEVDPSLPGYVGAVPPAGTPAWDWTRTWQAWPPGSLLTVSKEASDGGTYRTIGAALGAAKPWTTIRVLDAAAYAERLVLDNAARHEGIVLEAPRRATLEMGPRSVGFLTIKGVPNVRVRGFRFRQAKANVGSVFLTVTGHCPGVVLEDLELQGDGDAAVYGIVLFNVQNESHEAPLLVKRCTVRVQADGIVVSGPASGVATSAVSSGIRMQENRVSGAMRGILLQGTVVRAQVSGNLVWDCTQAALQVQDLGSTSRLILFSDNTAFDSSCVFRIWHEQEDVNFNQRQVEMCGNVFLDALLGDMLCITKQGDKNPTTPPDKARTLFTHWRFHHNWRDLSGSQASTVIPLAPDDQKFDTQIFLSRDPNHPDFMRPALDSQLATEGAGHDAFWLPSYAGAVPPKGVSPWDWETTWNARMRTPREQ